MTEKKKKPYIYLDNNSTTFVCKPACVMVSEWLNCFNPSGDHAYSLEVRDAIKKTSDVILDHCYVTSATHTIIFTSGATESNSFIIRSCVRSFKTKLLNKNIHTLPHIVSSSIEHTSIIETLKCLESQKEISVSYVDPNIYGYIEPEEVEKEIKPETCLIIVMMANNEIPTVNNISKIGQIAQKFNRPLHSDCTQTFGKFRFDISKQNISSISASAHKFYGPKGVGILIIDNLLIENYQLKAEICGHQQHGLRGGTENVAGIMGLGAALFHSFKKREEKNEKLFKLRNYIIDKISEKIPTNDYESYVNTDEKIKRNEKKEVEIVFLGPPKNNEQFILPNTILLSICKNRGSEFCNINLKKFLDYNNIIVGIGSACLTDNEKASHVLSAINAPRVIKKGVLRISLSDDNNMDDANEFVKYLIMGINKQCEPNYKINSQKIIKITKKNLKITKDFEKQNNDENDQEIDNVSWTGGADKMNNFDDFENISGLDATDNSKIPDHISPKNKNIKTRKSHATSLINRRNRNF